MKSIQCIIRTVTAATLLTMAAISPALASGDPIVGLWVIEGTPDGAPGPVFTNTAFNGKGGSVTNIDPWFGTGVGQWEKLGGDQYSISFTHYFLDGVNVGEVNVTAIGEVSANGQLMQGEFSTVISVNGFVVDSVVGTVEGTRQ